MQSCVPLLGKVWMVMPLSVKPEVLASGTDWAKKKEDEMVSPFTNLNVMVGNRN